MKKITLQTFLIFAILCTGLLSSSFAQDQKRVLVFTETNGFEHESIQAGIDMIERLGNDNELWATDNTVNATSFTSENLATYAAVIWCNTSGSDLLNEDQQAAFEEFIANGGGFVGIHAATDTYRDGSWPFYNELVGGIVQTMPNHTDSDYEATMTVVNDHPSVDFIEGDYTKVEEYYYWELNGGYLNPNNINLLEVEATGNESYDQPRPISWYKEYMGGRSFYTALGHNTSDYTDDENFIRHVEEGIKYVIGNTLSFEGVEGQPELIVYPNPVKDRVTINTDRPIESIEVFDTQGRTIANYKPGNSVVLVNHELNSTAWSPGIYFVKVQGQEMEETVKVLKR